MTTAQTIDAQPKGTSWHSRSAEDVLSQLASTADGLSSQEAAQRLSTGGSNALKEGKPISRLRIVLGQFKSLLIWILIAVGAIPLLVLEMVKIRRHARPTE